MERNEDTYLIELGAKWARVTVTITLPAAANLLLGYIGNSIVDVPWRLLEVWVFPGYGWAPAPSPTDTDDGIGPIIAALVLLTTPYLLMCGFINYLVTRAINVYRPSYALIAFVALIAPAVVFTIDPSLYADIPRY
ncbi:hypothetical protein [Streptomyces sp. NPDC051218]|uniref:hypothetical protein n=1 Tax=Streptomyces sp. NPDC051218 TaxID=3365645 RepID=UPI00378F1D52